MPRKNKKHYAVVQSYAGETLVFNAPKKIPVELGKGFVEKPAEDLKDLDGIIAAEYTENPSIPFPRIRHMLFSTDAEYRQAHDVVYYNHESMYIPQMAYSLIAGMLDELKKRKLVNSKSELMDILTYDMAMQNQLEIEIKNVKEKKIAPQKKAEEVRQLISKYSSLEYEDERYEKKGKIIDVVFEAIKSAISQYNLRHDLNDSESLSAVDQTIMNWINWSRDLHIDLDSPDIPLEWIVKDTWKSNKPGIYQALAEYDPSMQGWADEISSKPKWQKFSSWENDDAFMKARRELIRHHKEASRYLNENEGVTTSSRETDVSEAREHAVSDKPAGYYKEKMAALFNRLGIKGPKKSHVVVYGKIEVIDEDELKRRGLSSMPPRNIRLSDGIIEHENLEKYSIPKLINEARLIRRIFSLAAYECLDFFHHIEALSNKKGNSYLHRKAQAVLSSYNALSVLVPEDGWARINRDYNIIYNHPQVIVDQVYDSMTKNLLGAIDDGMIDSYVQRAYKVVMAEEQAEIKNESDDRTSLETLEHMMKHYKTAKSLVERLRVTQPVVPGRYIEMLEIQMKMVVADRFMNGVDPGPYSDYALPMDELLKLDKRIQWLSRTLRETYGKNISISFKKITQY